MLPVAKPNTINPTAEVWISAESEPRSSDHGVRIPSWFSSTAFQEETNEALHFCCGDLAARRRPARRAVPAGLESARRSQHERVGPRRGGHHQVRDDGRRLPCDQSPGRGLLEPGQYGDGKLHAQGHVHADEAERPHELLRPRPRWQRSRRPEPELPVLPGGAGRHLARSNGARATPRPRMSRPRRPATP